MAYESASRGSSGKNVCRHAAILDRERGFHTAHQSCGIGAATDGTSHIEIADGGIFRFDEQGNVGLVPSLYINVQRVAVAFKDAPERYVAGIAGGIGYIEVAGQDGIHVRVAVSIYNLGAKVLPIG